MRTPPVVLSIAGYDPFSGAGITADIKTAAAQGCYLVTCITALTVQSSQGVFEVQPVDAGVVTRTLQKLANDLDVAATRLGMIGSGAVAAALADFLEARRPANVVLDPIIRASSGTALVDPVGLEVLRRRLLPLTTVITPNLDEAAELAGAAPITPNAPWEGAVPWLRACAARLRAMGCRGVLITGGHLPQPNDFLSYHDGKSVREEVLPGKRIDSQSTHGTGCAFATALACQLALGEPLPEAARKAKDYVRRAIENAYRMGKGTGPLNHMV